MQAKNDLREFFARKIRRILSLDHQSLNPILFVQNYFVLRESGMQQHISKNIHHSIDIFRDDRTGDLGEVVIGRRSQSTSEGLNLTSYLLARLRSGSLSDQFCSRFRKSGLTSHAIDVGRLN